ncbi:MAG: class I adenylate-forming enzyme family protein [Pseudomonadota bacterium]
MAVVSTLNSVIAEGRWFNWGQLKASIAEKFDLDVIRHRRVMFAAESELHAASLVVAGLTAGMDFGIVEIRQVTPQLLDRFYVEGITLSSTKTDAKLSRDPFVSNFKPGRVTVLTSGTTGVPKLIEHSSNSLNTFDRLRNVRPRNWFVPYQIGSYAWYQMIFLSLFVDGQSLILGQADDLMGSFDEALKNKRVDAVSATPTFWRQAAMSIEPEVLSSSGIKSLSLGGEVVDQSILDYLSDMFPDAEIKHIFASSETGAAIVVSDRKAGFSAKLLEQDHRKGIELRVDEGRLQILSRYGSCDKTSEWIDTGDLVELVDDRVYFRGRADNSMINVGGQKAYPAAIEAVLLEHPSVLWARVSAQRAPLVGYLPQAKVVLSQIRDEQELELVLTSFCEERLPEHAVPRLWSFLEDIPIAKSLKS